MWVSLLAFRLRKCLCSFGLPSCPDWTSHTHASPQTIGEAFLTKKPRNLGVERVDVEVIFSPAPPGVNAVLGCLA
jgi:hypothetical protein